MIAFKTAVLVAAALKMGAIVAHTSKENADAIYKFGLYLGTAFQLQDDYLDAFGNPETFGKQVGGDILENKKTFLYLKTVELATESDKAEFISGMNAADISDEEKVSQVKVLYKKTGAEAATAAAVEQFTLKAFKVLEDLEVAETNKHVLKRFGE